MDIAENIKRIRAEIESAALKSGRQGADITLVAATKTNSSVRIREAIKAGISDCGENRVQELIEKLSENAYEGSRLHFIGHLQRNKVKQLVGAVSLIQSVDSSELVSTIASRAETLKIVQNVLLEVNIGREQAKSGVDPDKLEELLDVCSKQKSIKVEGLMAIPPAFASPGETRLYFEQMHKLFVDIKTKKYDNISMDILSMGMSGDYEEAILAGSNMIRVGSAIFGPRATI